MKKTLYSSEDLRLAAAESKSFFELSRRLGFKNRNDSTYDRVLRDMISNGIDHSHLKKKCKYNIPSLREIVKTSYSIRDALRKLGVSQKDLSRAYSSLIFEVHRLSLDISHFDGRQHLKLTNDILSKKTIPLELVFENKIPMKSAHLRRRLISEEYKLYLCEKCKRSEYLGEIIPLELHHKNGNNVDNSFENIEILCPNCHSLTPTFGGRNIRIDRHLTKKKLQTLSDQSVTLNELITKIYGYSNGYYIKVIRSLIEENKINTTHWVDYWQGCNNTPIKVDLDSILRIGSTIQPYQVKQHLFKAELKTNICEVCKITDWDGQELLFALDHINGIRTDNRLINLRTICYICHYRTPTYCMKNVPVHKRGKGVAYSRPKVKDLKNRP